MAYRIATLVRSLRPGIPTMINDGLNAGFQNPHIQDLEPASNIFMESDELIIFKECKEIDMQTISKDHDPYCR